MYRAHQSAVGRDVAVKVILPEFANHPNFIRRFEAEARLVAQLEHFHIVPLFDYWREPDGAYLVMRWLRGGSLAERLAGDAVPPKVASRMVTQVAAALTVAHSQGVVHRDLKPGNILLDEEDNAFLTDFGIAKVMSSLNTLENGGRINESEGDLTQTGAIVGSPGYMAPEQADRQPVTPKTDIYSFGVILYELLTGENPFPGVDGISLIYRHLTEPLPSLDIARADLPSGLNDVIQAATAKDPDKRFPDAQSLAAAFHRAVHAEVEPVHTQADLLQATNPYKGLRAFQENDAEDFFGREALSDKLAAHFRTRSRFLAVVGPSGSGKSSVVRAGLIPALRRGVIPGSDRWFITDMIPGMNPMRELASALGRVAIDPPADLLTELQTDVRRLAKVNQQILSNDQDELLLVIDQFEEIFTLVEKEADRAHFLESLLQAVTVPDSNMRIILTLRADFYDRPLLYPKFGDLVRTNMETVMPLSPEELEQAIAGPAVRVGARLEAGLAGAIVADVSEQPGVLPLLQYALTELFERRVDDLLTMSAYRDSGGVTGALARRADEIYANLDTDVRAVTRQLFLRLVTLGEGTEDTRRRVLRNELLSVEGDTHLMSDVIDRYGQFRLLSFDRDPITRSPTVEVAHEALIREWQRLRDWLHESREEVRLQRRITATATEWYNANMDASFLALGARLQQFEGWAATTDLTMTQTESDYLRASLVARETRQAEEQKRLEREMAARAEAEAERDRARVSAALA